MEDIFNFEDAKVKADPYLDYDDSLQTQQQDSETLIGNDITNIEAVRSSVRSQFDRNLVTQYDIQEKIFDYILSHLGVNSEGRVNHPIVLTDAPANPLHCTNSMTELLFECYHVPSVLYGSDAMFSLYHTHLHSHPSADALVISLGYQTMHILPVLGGQCDISRAKRVNLGGAHIEGFLQRLLQLKYPDHGAALTLSRSEEIIKRHCHVATDYLAELAKWSDVPYYNSHVHQIQLPFNKVTAVAPSAEQMKERRELQVIEGQCAIVVTVTAVAPSAEQTKERRELQVKRLKDIHRRKKETKLTAHMETLQKLRLTRDLMDDGQNIGESGESREQLTEDIDHLAQTVEKLTQALLGNGNEETKAKSNKQKSKPDKGVVESEEMERKRLEDFDGWLDEMRSKRQKLVEKRKERSRHKNDMSKRRTLASQQRMSKLTKLAAGEKKKNKSQDTFGMKDSDWDIYKEINRDCSDSDTDSDEDSLTDIDALLSLYDPQLQTGDEGGGEMDISERYRIHIAVEQIRGPELMFQPSMIGDPQAGLTETIAHLLKSFSPAEQDRLMQYVYITGGLAKLPHLKERLDSELLEMRPFQSTFTTHIAGDPVLDGWSGAAQFSQSPLMSTHALTRSMYEEGGLDYCRKHGRAFVPRSVLVDK